MTRTLETDTENRAASLVIRGADVATTVPSVRDGSGPVTLRRYLFDGAPSPANFVCYDIPPGSSEGLHTHFADDRNGIGAYDEFYYIVRGRGVMTLADQEFDVAEGDGIFAPLDLPRGIRNPDASLTLIVHITFISRERPG